MILGSVQTKPKERVLDQSQMQKNETLGQVQEPTRNLEKGDFGIIPNCNKEE